ncbi:MAG TPA: hypothetical protein VHN14_22415 [Kofleriaceae bacterium]|nr:hypothetical protein [Kofleriaceae bacterium]
MRRPVSIAGSAGIATSVGVAVLVLGSAPADAYPQYQLSRDQMCSDCHLSPAGGGLLSENGYNVAEMFSQFGTAPEFTYGKIPTPSWLALGGDLRGAAGYIRTPDNAVTGFPMQADLYLHAAYKGFSLQLVGGARPAQWITNNGTPGVLDRLWSREHYVMWQQNEGGGDGLFIRTGRFMPVFGLRLVEHPDYTRRYGGTPLYAETYAAAVEYVTPAWEAHVTGFVEDPLIDPVVHDSGVAGYGEVRLNPRLAVGGEAMLTTSDGQTRIRAGATGKLYVPGADVLVQAELQFVHQQVTGPGTDDQLVGYVMGSRSFGSAFLLDLGLGHYDENLAIQGLDRDAVDINLHWFVTSHLELVLQNRIEGIGLGSSSGGPTSGWVLLHGHYRL